MDFVSYVRSPEISSRILVSELRIQALEAWGRAGVEDGDGDR